MSRPPTDTRNRVHKCFAVTNVSVTFANTAYTTKPGNRLFAIVKAISAVVVAVVTFVHNYKRDRSTREPVEFFRPQFSSLEIRFTRTTIWSLSTRTDPSVHKILYCRVADVDTYVLICISTLVSNSVHGSCTTKKKISFHRPILLF